MSEFSFRIQLIHIVEKNLITNHIKQMLSKNFDTLIDENRFESVGLMYDLFYRVGLDGINDLREAFANYIKVKNLNEKKNLLIYFKGSWSSISN